MEALLGLHQALPKVDLLNFLGGLNPIEKAGFIGLSFIVVPAFVFLLHTAISGEAREKRRIRANRERLRALSGKR